jgi:hypothetical protein
MHTISQRGFVTSELGRSMIGVANRTPMENVPYARLS